MTRLHIEVEMLPPVPDFSTEYTEHAVMTHLLLEAQHELGPTGEVVEKKRQEFYQQLRDHTLLVARDTGRLAGIAQYNMFRPPGFDRVISQIGALATVAAYRGQGIVGPALLNEVLAQARAHDALYVDLWCYQDRVNHYQRRGFGEEFDEPEDSNLHHLRHHLGA